VGHVAALAYGANHHGFEAVNLGTGHGSSVLEVIHAYEKACGRKIPVEITDRRAGDVAVSYADVSKAKELLGWEASADLQQMCSDSWRFTLQNPNGL
jgi:UDP-glucose 4-epimerase